MTKAECEKALEDAISKTDTMNNCCAHIGKCLKSDKCHYDDTVDDCLRYKTFNTLKQLINEHFDNPPLEFDDLKPGMWVWDDEEKMYYQIESIEGNKIMIIDQSCHDLPWGVYSLRYHETRFYRRQKEDLR